VDGAHNPDGASTLARYLASLPRDRRRTLVLGGGSDKDIRAVAVALAPQVDRILTTVGTHPRARSPWEVARELEGLMVPVVPSGGLPEALASARNGEDLVIVAGSLYLIGDVREHLGVS
jgi:dihydrofolate synthase/folylpolyglutamate synthase